MAEAELIKLIKLSVPTLVVVIVILFILTIFKARWAADTARKTEMETENLRKEMELLAKDKIAQRADGSAQFAETIDLNITPVTAPPETRAAEPVTKEILPDDKANTREETVTDGFIEGEPLA